MNKLESQVLRMIGESASSPDVFKDNEYDLAPVRDSINDAIQEIAMLHGGYTETFNVPLISTKSLYRLTFKRGFLGWVQDAWLVTQKRRLYQTSLLTLNNYDPRWFVHEATPKCYFQIGMNVVGFSPKPSSSTDVAELTCVVIPDKYSNEDERIKVRDTFQRAVVNYAVSEYWAGRGDAKEATSEFMTYMENLGVKGIYRPRPDMTPTHTTEKNREAT